MSDLTPDQQFTFIVQALEQLGFAQVEDTNAWKRGDIAVILDKPEKPQVCRIVDGKRTTADTDGDLAKIAQIVKDAQDGIIYNTADVFQHDKKPNEMPAVPAPQPAPKSVPALKPEVEKPRYEPQGSIIHGFVPQLKEIGKIKIGRKGQNKTASGHRLPEKFDHFEIVSLFKDGNGDFIPDPIMQSLGPDPKELDVVLLYNDPTLNFLTRFNEYKGGKCQCQGNGQTAVRITGETVSCNPDTCSVFQDKKCKPNGILSVILTKSPRLGGVYKFRTTSWNSIRSLLSSMFFLRSATGGIIAGIPLKLTIAPQTVQPKNSQTAQTIYVVNLEFQGTMETLMKTTYDLTKERGSMRAEIQQLEQTARLALEVPETEEEIREVEAEFYPEEVK